MGKDIECAVTPLIPQNIKHDVLCEICGRRLNLDLFPGQLSDALKALTRRGWGRVVESNTVYCGDCGSNWAFLL